MPEALQVPFVDLARQFRSIEPELTQAFVEVGRSGGYIMGERLAAFERDAAAYLGVAHCLGVANGSDALLLVMKGLDIGPGDEVITAPNSFFATAWTIAATGATPVFADVGTDLNLDPARVEDAVTPRTKAIMPVHLTGRPAKMDEMLDIARRRGLFVIEDAAQAIGAMYRGRRVGSIGTAAGFSLHPLKNLGVYGDGGLITTNDGALAARLSKLRNHGLRNRDECDEWGINSRLDTLQAAIAHVKLRHLERWNARCREIADVYRTGLAGVVEVPIDDPWEHSVYHNFVVRTPARDEIMQRLKERGVDTRVHYPVPIHLQRAAQSLGYTRGSFPNAERFAETMISLPIYPELTDTEVSYVVDTARDVCASLAAGVRR